MAAGQTSQKSDAARRTQKMNRAGLAQRGLAFNQGTIGRHGQPRGGKTASLGGQKPQHAADVFFKLHDDERGGVFEQFQAAIGQRSGFPNANARGGQFPPQRRGPASGAFAHHEFRRGGIFGSVHHDG